jgi:hypothetical protein
MPRYLLPDGEIQTLSRHAAADIAHVLPVQEVDDAGKPVAPAPVDDLERFRAHERVGFLRERLAEAKSHVDQIQARLDEEERALAAEVRAIETKRTPKEKPAAAAALVKE